MRGFHNLKVWLRLVGAIGVIGIVTTGVTYAALQSQQASLVGNSIETATAALQLSKDGANFTSSAVGFDFAGLVPGGPAMPSQYGGYPIWFRNMGSATLQLNALVAALPTTTSGVDLSKVFVVLTPVSTGGQSQSISIASLVAAKTTGGIVLTTPSLPSNASIEYKVQVQMPTDAFSGDSASISNLDLVFGGTAVTQ